MILMYVRHGDAKDDKLTELGKQQCEVMVKQDESFNFSKIYSSPLSRCTDTAKYLEKKHGVKTEILTDLIERHTLERDPETENEQEWFDNYLNKNFSNSEPEGCKDYLKRTYNALDKIINEHKDKNENVIIVAHSCTYYAIMSYFNESNKNDINWYRISNCAKVYFEIK